MSGPAAKELTMSEDTAYYRERANAERALALKSARQNIAEIHEELARLYQALADQETLRPTLRIVMEDRERQSA